MADKRNPFEHAALEDGLSLGSSNVGFPACLYYTVFTGAGQAVLAQADGKPAGQFAFPTSRGLNWKYIQGIFASILDFILPDVKETGTLTILIKSTGTKIDTIQGSRRSDRAPGS